MLQRNGVSCVEVNPREKAPLQGRKEEILQQSGTYKKRLCLGLAALLLPATLVAAPAGAADEDQTITTTLEQTLNGEEVFVEEVQVESVEGFHPDGGEAVIGGEQVTYNHIDKKENLLLDVGRSEPQTQTTGTAVATENPTATRQTFQAEPLPITPAMEGADYTYRLNDAGVAVLTGRYALGTLNEADVAGGGNDGPTIKNLKKTMLQCVDVDLTSVEGYVCIGVYKPTNGDGSATYNYRVLWWSGTQHAKQGHDMEQIKYQNWFPSTAPASQTNTEYHAPFQTVNPSACNKVTLSLGWTRGPVSVGISETFRRCPDRFGPDKKDHNTFWAGWYGEKDWATWVGLTGGNEFRFKDGANWQVEWRPYYATCSPDWWCQ